MKFFTSKRILSILLCLCLICMTCTSCSSLKANQDFQFLQQLEQTVTQTQSLLNDSMSIASEMATATYGLVPGEDAADYASLCRTNADLIEQKAGNIRKLMQELERSDAPKTDRGKALYEAQKEYFEDALSILNQMEETLVFFAAQYDAGVPLITAITSSQDDYQQYLSVVYDAALSVKDDYLQLDTPSYLGELWPLYTSSIDMFTQYLYAQSWGAVGDVLRQYSSAQLISRMGIVASAYENAIYELMAREYIHCEDVIDQNLKVLGAEILDGCKNGTLPQDSYMQMSCVLFTNYTLIDEIYPNLYPATNSIVNLAIYTDKDFRDVTVTAEIPGFTQVYEQKLTITPEITYLMIKPPVLSDMPDLSSAKDTQLIFKITDNITGDIIAQESQSIKLYSIYDYRSNSDEFGVIQNDNILAWMTPESEGVLAVRRNAVAWLEQNLGRDAGMLPGYQPAYGYGDGEEANITYIQIAAIQSAISAMGVRYNMGPYSLNATQRVLMPDAVLASQSGICIETAVLMASVLQSADMHPMIVFTPGHAQVAVESWSGSGQYFLIETTNLPFDASVDDMNTLTALYSSEDWAEYLSQSSQKAQQSGGMVYIVDCDLAKILNIKGLAY
ncbi:MAG: hypothetical protein Q4E29_00370 [Lachnospiraceae bacterium]|nr:hypothetical protein [Lachnospiraceae bacterium]